jgi:hypothetical protein
MLRPLYPLGKSTRYSSVPVPFGLEAGRGGRPAGPTDVSLLRAVRTGLGPTQPPIQWVPEAVSPGVKRQGREAGSPPSSGEVKNGGAMPPLSQVASLSSYAPSILW